jgi:hypothetical protein
MQVEVLASTTKETQEMVTAKLAEKDRELQLLHQRDELNNDALAVLAERLMELETKFNEQNHYSELGRGRKSKKLNIKKQL